MSYYGTVSQMIRSIKYNNSLRKRRSVYKEYKRRYEQEVGTKAKYKENDVDPQELARIKASIREKMSRERRVVNIGIIAFVVSVVGMTTWWVIANIEPVSSQKPIIKEDPVNREITPWTDAFMEETSLFLHKVNDGYRWLGEKHFHNALYQFEKAVEMKPHNYKARLGLTKTLIAQCQAEGKNCDSAEQSKRKLIEDFGDSQNVEEEIEIFMLVLG